MATQITTRTESAGDAFGGGLAGSFLLHATLAALLLGWAWFTHSGQTWGSTSVTAGAIQATMVNALPALKQPSNQNGILASDLPSPAPIPPAPHTIAAPKPDDIPIPTAHPKPAKIADKTTQAPPLHPQPITPPANKAPAGEAPGMRTAVISTQTRAGTISVNVPDAGFGFRYAYYVNEITQKVASQWYTSMLDPQAAGHRVYITFQIARDGSVSHIQIAQRSGDSTLDQTALSAVEHIDTFPPLPEDYAGNYINVTYYFDPPPRQ